MGLYLGYFAEFHTISFIYCLNSCALWLSIKVLLKFLKINLIIADILLFYFIHAGRLKWIFVSSALGPQERSIWRWDVYIFCSSKTPLKVVYDSFCPNFAIFCEFCEKYWKSCFFLENSVILCFLRHFSELVQFFESKKQDFESQTQYFTKPC